MDSPAPLSLGTESAEKVTFSTPTRKWSLTREAFDRLLDSLADDRESAGTKYLELRGNLIRFFQWRGCPFPEDHADETVNRVAKRLAEGEEILNPSGYCIGVARLLVLEILKARARESLALGEMASANVEASEASSSETRIECLQECLHSLSDDNRHLILAYYQGDKGEKIKNRKNLTVRLGVPVNTLRMRALRLREKLQACVEDCVNT